MNESQVKGRTAAEVAAEARASGAEWVLYAGLAARPVPDGESGMWRAPAELYGEIWDTAGPTRKDALALEASAVDVSSIAAVVSVSERLGEDAAARLASFVGESRGTRSTAVVGVLGGQNPAALRRLLASLRRVEGVASAGVTAWRDRDGFLLIGVALTGMKVDGLAARLLREDPSITMLGVETEFSRLMLEAPGLRP
jgi:hypothetical protein